MTALKEYARLESGGVWKEHPDAPPTDAIISFGSATLVIADGTGQAIAHWSLPAINRVNSGIRPAVFALDSDTNETLIVEDDLMIDAIEKVRRSLVKNKPQRRAARGVFWTAVCVGAIAAGTYWGPSMLRDQTLAAVPTAKRNEIGASLLGHVQLLVGKSCRSAQGRQAISQLRNRLFGQNSREQIVVVPVGNLDAIALPGSIVILDGALLSEVDDPALIAGYLLAADTRAHSEDSLRAILEEAGISATFSLFTTGDLPAGVLRDYAEIIVAGALPQADTKALSERFANANVANVPYGNHRDINALKVPLSESPTAPVLSDAAWVSLRGICET